MAKPKQQPEMTEQRRAAAEAKSLVDRINSKFDCDYLTTLDRVFVLDMSQKVKEYGEGLIISDRQLGRLRDLKEKLIEAGEL